MLRGRLVLVVLRVQILKFLKLVFIGLIPIEMLGLSLGLGCRCLVRVGLDKLSVGLVG